MRRVMLISMLGLLTGLPASAAEWVRAGLTTNQPLWGIRDGLQFAIHPGSFRGLAGGPRGLIRLGYPVLPGGRYDLLNFIAVEPVVKGKRGFSELEYSRLDRARGKRFQAVSELSETTASTNLVPGRLWHPANGVEQLDVILRLEQFENGAHVYLICSQRSDSPDEITLTIHAEPDSAPMDWCILTATMGNLARARLLWLKDETVGSRTRYPDYKDIHFAEPASFPLRRLFTRPCGDVLVAITTNEENPATVRPFAGTDSWYYGGSKVTQFWRKPKGTFREDLHAVVNARYTYWQSQQPIPGGIAFENFELQEQFCDGQQFVFGITRKTPQELGFPAPSARGQCVKRLSPAGGA
jgi:hypothetical protein